LVLQEFINVVNVDFRHHIKWPKGDYLVEVMGFKAFFGLPSIHGMIDVIQIHF
jgi:hypothetical protein